ncbi:MAG: hypothetical protein ACI9QV_000887 [Methylophagaceae bacterium]|jgi:hypothetical protein
MKVAVKFYCFSLLDTDIPICENVLEYVFIALTLFKIKSGLNFIDGMVTAVMIKYS